MLWVFICTVHLIVCYYHVRYKFLSESTLHSCLNVKELLARKRRHIWSLSDSNGIRLRTNWLWVHIPLQWLKFQLWRVLSKEFLDIQVTIECRFIQNLGRDMIITYNQILFPVSGLYFSGKKTEIFGVELNLQKQKWLILCCYNPHKHLIKDHLLQIKNATDFYFI